MKPLYYNSIIMLDMVYGTAVEVVEQCCSEHGFTVVGVDHCVAKGNDPDVLFQSMRALVKKLNDSGFDVRRYKLESTLFDSSIRVEECRALPSVVPVWQYGGAQ